MAQPSCTLLLLLATTALAAPAQTVTRTILGVVTDPSGASVTATNRATGVSRSAKSEREGNYVITFVHSREQCE